MNRPAALVTGSGVRLGKAIALDLAHAGYDVAVHYNRSAEPAQDTVAEIHALGMRAEAFQFDLRLELFWKNYFVTSISVFGIKVC